MSEETKQRISNTTKGRVSPLKGKVGCFKNRKPPVRQPTSEETKKKISDSNKGKHHRPRKLGNLSPTVT